MNKKTPWIVLGILAVLVVIFFTLVPAGRSLIVKWDTSLEEVDEGSYKNAKKVEDTCRAMISSYKSDKITYETYKDSEDEEERGWAKQAKIRANTAATQYNEYYLKNSHVWKENVPDDINTELEVIE